MNTSTPTIKRVKIFIAIIVPVMVLTLVSTVIFFLITPRSYQGIVNPKANVSLPNFYENGMVFQRNKSILIRGTADAGTRLTVSLDDGTHSTSTTIVVSPDNTFAARLNPPAAQLTPYTLTITSGGSNLLTIDETYVGDVFLASGQSNMEVNFHDYYSTDELIEGNINGAFQLKDLPDFINDANVHFLVTDNSDDTSAQSNLPLRSYCRNHWLKANRANAKYLGYLSQSFAATLRSLHPDIPVGIIQTAWGGTGITEHMKGGHIYQTHVKPLQGLSLAGIIWYQGEKDAMVQSSTKTYTGNFLALIRQYRTIFRDTDLPFLYVQLARYSENPYTSEIQIAQLQALNALGLHNNVAMTVALDTDKGTSKIIHPLGKDILGQRLAYQWNSIRQGKRAPSGPIVDRATKQSNGSVVISFKTGTSNGLCAMRPVYSTDANPSIYAFPTSSSLTGFEVLGPQGTYVKAEATIVGDTVVVHSNNIRDIVSVRYAWTGSDNSVLLYNDERLPASPFILTAE